MYINYSVTPQNITEIKMVEEQVLSRHGQVEVKYETYDPQSYLIITVKSKASGNIYLEDGFGKDYTTYLTRTLKVINTDDMFVEIKGNKIKATVNFWVKPLGNFDNPDNMTFDTCTYWGQTIRDNTAVAYAVPETTATPEYADVPTPAHTLIPVDTRIAPWHDDPNDPND